MLLAAVFHGLCPEQRWSHGVEARPKWDEFQPRLTHWMAIWEVTGQRAGLNAREGFILGTPAPGMADIVTATLWATMADRFPAIAALLEQTAPCTAGLTRRVQAVPELAALILRSWAQYGQAWCGVEIEASLRSCQTPGLAQAPQRS